VYIYVDRPPNAPLAPPVREFLRYILSLEGQRAVEQEGIFMPLPAHLAAVQSTKLE
jgi:phosphate transport system substrate-binding protein